MGDLSFERAIKRSSNSGSSNAIGVPRRTIAALICAEVSQMDLAICWASIPPVSSKDCSASSRFISDWSVLRTCYKEPAPSGDAFASIRESVVRKMSSPRNWCTTVDPQHAFAKIHSQLQTSLQWIAFIPLMPSLLTCPVRRSTRHCTNHGNLIGSAYACLRTRYFSPPRRSFQI